MLVSYMFIEFLATIFINARSMPSKYKVRKIYGRKIYRCPVRDKTFRIQRYE